MRALAEWVADQLLALRETSGAQLVLRLLIAFSGLGVVALLTLWLPFFFGPALAFLIGLCALGSALFPDSLAQVGAICLVALWWVMVGSPAPWWQAVAIALLLAVGHLAAAWAASGPHHAAMHRSVVARFVRAGVLYLGVVGVLIAGVIAVSSAVGTPPLGVLWMVLGAASVIGLAAWMQRRSS